MKKILTLAVAVLGFGFAAKAQIIADLEPTLISPLMPDETTPFTVPCSDSFNYEFVIVNAGPGTIRATDTVYYYSPLVATGFINYATHNSAAVAMGDTVVHISQKITRASLKRLFPEDGGAPIFSPFANGNYLLA